ncbi:Endonuclease/exonuclease/phosphatase [Obelidium mucronatum]|nr:Endonuclease/exonuclease/phosphatase [Obelidium mucronatum]
MDIVSWNVNGFMALKKLFPKESNKDLLDKLVPSKTSIANTVYCLQEFKCTKDRIIREGFAAIDGFHSFHAYSKHKTGYSGVSTITPKTLLATPFSSQQGFLGGCTVSPLNGTLSGFSCPELKIAVNSILSASKGDTFTIKELKDMDEEGRLVISDHGLFILVNGYFPRACPDEEARFHFKTRFQRAISLLIKSLTQTSKRNVILLGDLNVCHKPIDHCDPGNNVRENKLDEFGDTAGRKWMDELMEPTTQGREESSESMLVDLFRWFQPDRKGAFTCWNTLIDARRANFGTRLDYILVSPKLLPWFEGCDIRPDVMGSDHCPVVARLAAKNPETHQLLSDVMGHSVSNLSAPTPAPPGCAELWDEVSGKGRQTSLKGWFGYTTTAVYNSHTGSHGVQSSGLKRKAEDESIIQGQIASDFTAPATIASKPTTNPTKKPATAVKQPSISAFFKKGPSTCKEPPPIQPAKSASLPDNEFEEYSSHQFTSAATLPSSSSSSATTKLESVNAWKSLLKKPENPKCYHGEETKEFRQFLRLKVNKSGPNQGRMFYLCARAVGPSDAKPLSFPENTVAGVSGEEQRLMRDSKWSKTVTEFRCNYFQWKKTAGGSGSKA